MKVKDFIITKYLHLKNQKKKNYNFIFEIGDEQYIISFENNTFIYDVNLDFGKKIIGIRRKISQIKEYKEKMDIFIEALK